MNHLDEGTIHAWLDDALDAERAREVEVHVRNCAACSAAVAEARGLIAASSRILSALDDVPAQVIPARPANAPKPPKPPKRQWRAAPWVTGIAAILLATILLRPTRDEPDAMVRSAKLDTVQRDARAMLDTLRPRQTPARVALSPIAGAARPAVPARARVDEIVATRAADAPADAPAKVADMKTLAEASAMSSAASGNAVSAEHARDEQMRRRAALAPQPTLENVIVTSAAERVMLPDSLPPSQVAGCYEIEGRERDQGLSEMLSGKATAKASRAAAAVPAAAQPLAGLAPPITSVLVRLDTLRGRAGFIVRSATTESVVGWWWRVHRDSARVNLPTAGTYTVTPARRVRCPGEMR